MNKPKCNKSQILNPLTNRCIDNGNPTGRYLVSTKNKACNTKCDKDRICNNKTGNCILIKSQLGKFIKELGSKSIRTKSYLSKTKLQTKSIIPRTTPRTTPMKCITSSKIPLLPHQIDVVNRVVKNDKVLVVHSVGSGKTLSACASINCVLQKHPTMNVYIVSPKSLTDNMKKELKNSYGKRLLENPNIQFFTFDKFYREYIKDNISCKNAFLIIDEVHNIRNSVSKKVKKFLSCSKLTKKVLLLTATPIINGIKDLETILSYIGVKISMVDIIINDPVVRRNLKKYVSYFMCTERKDYPETNEHDIKLEMSKKFYDIYLKIQLTIEDYSHLKPAFYTHIRTSINKTLGNVDSEKIVWVIDKIAERLKSHKRYKAVVYTNWIESGVDILTDKLKKKKIKYDIITGSISRSRRTEIVSAYNNDELRVLFISKAGSEGLDLKGTRNLFICEPTWNDAGLTQIKGRVSRYKSHLHLPKPEQKVDIYNMYLVKPKDRLKLDSIPSADEIMKEIIDTKKLETNIIMKYISKNASIC